MTLNKRYKRDIKNNLSLYISSTVLTVLALLLFYLYYICGTGIRDFSDSFFKELKLEDANFGTYAEIPDEKIAEYEEKYNLVLEKQPYININTDGVNARVFGKTEKTDLYKITKGSDAAFSGEVIISEGYAVNSNINIGDKIKIGDREYTVSGFMERPDYLYMLENPADTEKNVITFFICYMSDGDFEALGDKNYQYLVRYNEDNSTEFRKDVHSNYIMSSYLAADDNIRITMVTVQPQLFIQMSYIILLLVPMTAVIFISIILSRKIRSEQKMTGTLAACGYSPAKIIMHYAGFSAIPGIIGGILTTVLTAVFADPYGRLGLMDYEPIDVDFTLRVPQMLLGIIVPTALYILSTVITVKKLLKNDITVLLAGQAMKKKKTGKMLADKNCSFRIKFSVRSLFGNPGRNLVLFAGVFLGSLICIFAFSMLDSAENTGKAAAGNMGGYNYRYVLSTLSEENKYGGEPLLAASVEDEDSNILILYGADKNSLINCRDENGNKITVDDGYYITGLYSKLTGVKAGDRIKTVNPLSAETFEIEIAGIVENNFEKAIYTSGKNVSRISGFGENSFNVILSKEKLDIPGNETLTVISRDTIDEQYEVILEQMKTLIFLFIFIGMLICIIFVYIAVKMTVSENSSDISMLSVLGYDSRRIKKLLLSDNIFIVIPAIILSFPAASFISSAMFLSFAGMLGYLIEVHTDILSYFLSTLIVLICYFVPMHFAALKIQKSDMAESLKDNRE